VRTLRLILGDQLNERHSWYCGDDGDCLYVLMEVRQETDVVLHHVQKLLGVLTAMRRFAEHLRRRGKRVLYLELNDPRNTQRVDRNLEWIIRERQVRRFEYQLPDDYRLDRQLAELCARLEVQHAAYDTEHFLSARGEVGRFFQGRKQYRMEAFYRHMRTRLGLLMNDQSPAGGRWNFDHENRSPYTADLQVPAPLVFENDCSSVYAELSASGVRSFGESRANAFPWPVNRAQGLALLDQFLEHALGRFGTYQDAMSRAEWALFHSRLSFVLNLKLLHPMEVVERAIDAWRAAEGAVGLPQIEGFVRQIIGWREYMRGIYWTFMPGYATKDALGHSRPLPGYYWTGNTKMNCMRYALGQSLSWAYAHHIQRLMVTGNFALLAGVDVDEVDAWYLGVYIDAFQWVEMPNTRGMSQYADGGIVATKPYAASARYIHRMSDYCVDCMYDHRPRHGESACPFNSLYWHFLERHRELLSENHRMAMVYAAWKRMDQTERASTIRRAEGYLDRLEEL
jgi:deoxyribodipyrimidine photolyase-related protein